MTKPSEAMMKLLGLTEKDFEVKDRTITAEERINDLEVALCEIADALFANNDEEGE